MAIDVSKLKVKAAQRYEKLTDNRRSYVDRARLCAALTIPALMPAAGFTASSTLPTPYQSLGARGVRTLASKLLLSLFPQVSFFNYRMDDKVVQEAGTKRGEIEKGLSSRERAVITELDISVFRPVAFTAFSYLLVAGNALLYIPPKQADRAQVFRLDQYVVRRDSAGNLLELVIKEAIDLASLPQDIRDQILKDPKFKDIDPLSIDSEPVEVYTHVFRDVTTGDWVIYQEAAGIFVEGSDGTFKKDELPYIALRFTSEPNEHYGRSYVEEYLGDLDSLEALSEALVEGSAASARIVFLVNPAGTTSLDVVAKAKNGDVKSGNAEDVTVMRVEKASDLSVAKAQAEEISTRLSYAFLLHSSIQRKGERVTAEEIRYMASELDDGLGGVYTLLAADLQLPAVRLFERRMELRLKPPKLPAGSVTPVLVAGLEAIGRGHDQRNLQMFVKEILQVLGPEVALQYLKPLELISRSAAAYSIDTEGLLPTEEEVAQQQQQMQLQQLASHLGPNAVNALGGAGKEIIKGAMQPQAAPAPAGG